MRIKVNGVETISRQVVVEIDPVEFLENLKISLCNVPAESFVKDGEVVTAHDISYHGSPCYEYKTHSTDQECVRQVSMIDSLVQGIKRKSF